MNLALDALLSTVLASNGDRQDARDRALARAERAGLTPRDVQAAFDGDLTYLSDRGAHPLLIMRLARDLDIDPIAALRGSEPRRTQDRSSTMHISFDVDKCDGFASCVIIAPELFALDDERSVAILLQENPSEDLRASAEAAAAACPMRAITIDE